MPKILPPQSDLLIIGAGGHARVVADILRARGELSRLIGFVDATAAVGSCPPGWDVPVLGDDSVLSEYAGAGFVIGIGSLKGGMLLRRKLFDRAIRSGLHPVSLLHNTSEIADGVALGEGTVVMAGVVINTAALIGPNVILNTRSVVEHDVVVGADVHVAPSAVISGGTQIGDGALIGVGAVVLQGRRIGAGATIGAGSVVVADVEAGETVMGVPAKPRG